MDNYYNSVALYKLLLERKTLACGTLCAHRGEPKKLRDVTMSSLKLGERKMVHDGRVMLLAWKDKRIVRMISTIHKDEMGIAMVRQKGQL